jgi:hypothetical protein
MKLNTFIAQLVKLQEQGHGDKEVFYTQSSSGDCGKLNSAHITDYEGECGPFDMDGAEYISISAGH